MADGQKACCPNPPALNRHARMCASLLLRHERKQPVGLDLLRLRVDKPLGIARENAIAALILRDNAHYPILEIRLRRNKRSPDMPRLQASPPNPTTHCSPSEIKAPMNNASVPYFNTQANDQ